MPSPLADALHALKLAFDAADLRWYLFGAQAAILHGAARLTADVDVTVAIGDRPTRELIAALEGAGIHLRVEADPEFIQRTRVLPAVHDASRFPIDIVLAGPGIEEQFLARSAIHIIEGIAVPVASAEDLVAMKILAGRAKDLEDATTMLRTRRDQIDLRQIRKTLRLLERALDQSDLLARLDVIWRGLRRH